jgi:general secretion pathway protein D
MMTFARSLTALAALLLGFSVAAQEPARPAPGAPKGANAPLQAAQQPPPVPAGVATPPGPAAARPGGEATPAKAPTIKPGEVLLNFQAADIQAVVKAISQMTGRNFLLDPRVKGQVTIISVKPVSTAAAYQIFLSALKA